MTKLSMSEEEMLKRKYTRPYEKRIAELEEKLANADYQLEGRDLEIKALEKENAELKEINEGYCRSRDRLISIGFPNFKDCKEYAEHLTKAKELLKEFVHHYKIKTIYIENMQDLLEQAGQFLSEVEK